MNESVHKIKIVVGILPVVFAFESGKRVLLWSVYINYSKAPAARMVAKRSPILIEERKGNPLLSWLAVLLEGA